MNKNQTTSVNSRFTTNNDGNSPRLSGPAEKSERIGVVANWFAPKGNKPAYGFITDADTKKDVFFPASAITGEGIRELDRGVAVAFVQSRGKKGPKATRVRALRVRKGVPVDDRINKA